MALRKYYSHKVVVLLIAGVVRIIVLFLLTYTSSSSCSVVTVSNIESRDSGEDLSDLRDILLVVDNPELVSETIYRGDIIVLSLFGSDSALHDSIDLRIVRICEEHRLKVGVLISYVNHTVILFVFAGKLVFLDLACHIIFYVGTYYKTVLGAAVHSLGIYVVVLFRILYQPSFLLP